jgi:sugar (pentulose or hexulose) kinase
LKDVLTELGKRVDPEHIQALCLDGTSGTVLLCDDAGQPLTPGLMYNDARANDYLDAIAQQAPAESAVHSATSGLAKLLWLRDQPYARYTKYFCHQADWLVGQLTRQYDISDINNCLKSGYDPETNNWPDWLEALGVEHDWLPRVVSPGELIGNIDSEVAIQLGLSPQTKVLAGTTDSTAAFMATGASQPGEAVTSLGSTLVMKVIAEQSIFDREHGVYSQPLGDYWLVGGGSNSGGAVLRHFFSDSQMRALEKELRINESTGLDYYPLLQPGERFPYNDPQWPPKMTPRPSDDTVFFQGLLEGLTKIEYEGYRLLEQLGAPYPDKIYTVGGGSVNQSWMQMREQLLDVSILIPAHTAAAYGMARLAQQGYEAQHD